MRDGADCRLVRGGVHGLAWMRSRWWQSLAAVAVSALACASARAQVAVKSNATGTVQLQTEQRVVLTVTGNFGSGCLGELRTNALAAADGRVQIAFADYKVALKANTPFDGKACTLTFAIQGVAGYQYTIQTVTFVGTATLLSPEATGKFTSVAWWDNRVGALTHPPLVVEGRSLDPWKYEQVFESKPAATSECSNGGPRTLTLQTQLEVENQGAQPASMSLDHLIGDAKVRTDDIGIVDLKIASRRCS